MNKKDLEKLNIVATKMGLDIHENEMVFLCSLVQAHVQSKFQTVSGYYKID